VLASRPKSATLGRPERESEPTAAARSPCYRCRHDAIRPARLRPRTRRPRNRATAAARRATPAAGLFGEGRFGSALVMPNASAIIPISFDAEVRRLNSKKSGALPPAPSPSTPSKSSAASTPSHRLPRRIAVAQYLEADARIGIGAEHPVSLRQEDPSMCPADSDGRGARGPSGCDRSRSCCLS
jgi:hypothetical protein